MKKLHSKEEVKRILYAYRENEPIIKEFDYLSTLFELHPSAEIKIGCGISVITVRRSKFNSRCFWITRKDGSETDISYLQCFTGKPTKRAYVTCACRQAISPIIEKLRQETLAQNNPKCPITGEILETGNLHIDHYDKTFAELFNEWIKTKDIDFLYSKLNDTSVDGETDVYFTDKEIIDDFVEFHDHNTHLRAVSKFANLGILRRNILLVYFASNGK